VQILTAKYSVVNNDAINKLIYNTGNRAKLHCVSIEVTPNSNPFKQKHTSFQAH